MKQDSVKAADIKLCEAVNVMPGIESRLDQLSGQLTRVAHRDQDTTAGGYHERSRPFAPDRSFADILADVETSARRAIVVS